MAQKILLIDGFSILNRAFYALPLLSTKEGEYTNGVYGFMNILLRFVDEEKPDYVTVAFDLPQPTFRHEAYGAYKGTRKGMPDELREQVPLLKKLLATMKINMAECAGFEADDVIGTLTAKAVEEGLVPVIVTGDRDLLQLATDVVRIRVPKTRAGKTEVEDYFASNVLEKYGVTPQAYIDVKALMGDTSDNVPGVPGIGEVTATKIIAEYGSVDNAIANAPQIKPKKASENLIVFKEQALLSRMLVTIVQDAPVELLLQSVNEMWNEEAQAEIKRLELKTLYKRFDGGEAVTTEQKRPELKFDIIQDASQARLIFDSLEGKLTALYLLWGENSLSGMALGTQHGTGNLLQYIAVDNAELSLFSQIGMSATDLLNAAKHWLESPSPKIIYDAKTEAKRLLGHGISLNMSDSIFDIMLAAYVLDPLHPSSDPKDIAKTYLGESLPTLEDILDNKGKRAKDRRTADNISQEIVSKYAVSVADALLRLQPTIFNKLVLNDQLFLYNDLELPVATALLNMELQGVKVDKGSIKEYGDMLTLGIDQLTADIHNLAGEEFNINSPAQVGDILFEKLGLKGGKKTTRSYSTAAEELEKIAEQHPIVPLIMEYRTISKLKSTYVDGLIPLINPDTSRIHTTFNQALTATGRLSSVEPNLQNIPIRLPLGRKLRKAFIPEQGCVFIDADYSQIELRLLAHLSGDKTLIKAYQEGADIHRITAAQVLGIPPEQVTDAERSNAKAVNFGIVYGISAFGLSTDLKISVKEADSYISSYFEKYPGVKNYLDRVVQNAENDGFVATIMNRRRAVPELRSTNFNIRSFGKRVAMNMPIQGSAADIIKLATINVANRLISENLKARIILQVHDELLLEVPEHEVAQVTALLKHEMEKVVSLDVPLVADIGVGVSWYETK